MSEDTTQLATDGAGIWRDPSGTVALGEPAENYVSVGHTVLVVCDSRRQWWTRLIIRRGARDTKRCQCPACGKMATLDIRGRR